MRLKYLRFCAALLCTVLLGGCSPLSLRTEDLMTPPKLSDLQIQVTTALTTALGVPVSNINLRYPKYGDYRSAFTFYDIDGCGQDEALVLYTISEGANSTRINVLKQYAEGWRSVYDTAGMGEGVDFIRLASLTAMGNRDIIIGWQNSEEPLPVISVLRFEDNKLNTLFTSLYEQYAIANFTSSPLEELVVVCGSDSGMGSYAQLVQYQYGFLENTDHISLGLDAQKILQIKAGSLTPSKQGVVVDVQLEDGTVASDIIAVDDGGLYLPLADNSLLYRLTYRNSASIATGDTNKDGILDIPSQVTMPSFNDTQAQPPLYFTEYRQLTDENTLALASTAYIDEALGYKLEIPTRWIGLVSAQRQNSTDEITFYVLKEDLDDHSEELLRLRVFSQRDYQDKFEKEKYFLLKTRGIFDYYALLRANRQNPLALTQEELTELFKLM